MSGTIAIKREASAQIKGITLQKLRALKIIFETVISNPNAQIHTAIEFNGDVYVYSDRQKLIEEDKSYSSKNFSFFSKPVLNTLIYFLDYWLSDTVGQSPNVYFNFYATNSIAKETESARVESLQITLPADSIIESLARKDFSDDLLLQAVRLILLDEYKLQYKGHNHHYLTLSQWSAAEWETFLQRISWQFDQPRYQQIQDAVTAAIQQYAQLKEINLNGREGFVRAWLFEKLEFNQYTDDLTQRFLTDKDIELIFYKIQNNQIPDKVYQFLEEDHSFLRKKAESFALSSIKVKYNALVPHRNQPIFLTRKVKQHSREVKITTGELREGGAAALENMQVQVGDIKSFIDCSKPTFLFGEIGSGKSSIIASYAASQNQAGHLSLLIPVTFLKGRITIDYTSAFEAVEKFVIQNLNTGRDRFNFGQLLLSRASFDIIIDGLDELDIREARLLLGHLQKTSHDHANIAIIVTGRPLELQSIINYNEWNCLTTIDLSEAEVYEILKNEAMNAGLNPDESENDTRSRLLFLKTRKDLHSIAKTPLIICLIRDYLTEQHGEETLGTLMYKILVKRLDWDVADLKQSYPHFFFGYPQVYQREAIIAAVAFEIAGSGKQLIHERKLFETIQSHVAEGPNKNIVVTEAIAFYKNVFLQQAGDFYSFTSQPLFEVAYAISVAEKIRTPPFSYEIDETNWRSLSFAIALNRLRGYISEMRPFLRRCITDMLSYEENTPMMASMISESKDSEMANLYIQKMDTLDFRPLYFWKDGPGLFDSPDSFSPFVIADVLHLAGAAGFAWFYKEYLDPSQPVIHGDESIIYNVLKNYFSIRSFQPTEMERNLISKIIPFHRAAMTFFCGRVFSVFSLVVPEIFDANEKGRLFTEALEDRLLHSKATALITAEIEAGNLKFISDGLEIVCAKDSRHKNSAISLWFKINGGEISDSILNAAIIAIAEGDQLLFRQLSSAIGVQELKSYLVFCSLNMEQTADHAAIILHEHFGFSNFHLIAFPIMQKTAWTNFRSPKRRDILNDILFTKLDVDFDLLMKRVPFRKNEEISELFLFYFLRLLLSSNSIHRNYFLYVVTHLPEYAFLSRYPELRDAFKDLIKEKPVYGEFLRQATAQLDFRLKFNASAILLVRFPENATKDLETTIRSAHSRLRDDKQWLRFCMKLNFSRETLQFVAELLPDLPAISKYYALFILYHQNYPLSAEQRNELLEGLVGEGGYLDNSWEISGSDGIKELSREDQFLPRLIASLESPNRKEEMEAASILFAYHTKKLTPGQKAKVFTLYHEEYSRSLYNQRQAIKENFADEDFTKALTDYAMEFEKINRRKPLLYLYYSVLQKDYDNWLPLLKTLIFEGRHASIYDVEFAYRWIKSLSKRKEFTEIVAKAGDACTEFLTYPIVSENKNSVYPQIALMANEFGTLPIETLKGVLESYKCERETACSLFYRINDIIEQPESSDRIPDYYNYFSAVKSSRIKNISQESTVKILLDGDHIPASFRDYIRSALVYGTFNVPDLDKLKELGKLGSFFFAMVSFCRNEQVDFSVILNASDEIGWPFYKSPSNGNFRAALYMIKEIQISGPESSALYQQAIVRKIEQVNDYKSLDLIDDFKELFNLDLPFPARLLGRLFQELDDRQYSLNDDLLYKILDYIATHVVKEDYPCLSKLSEDYIKGWLSQTNKERRFAENIIFLWMFSLISFFTNGEAHAYAVHGYLYGLQLIFTFNTDRTYLTPENEKIQFKPRDLLIHSSPLYDRIDPDIFKKAVEIGITDGTDEIKAICRVFSGFVRN